MHATTVEGSAIIVSQDNTVPENNQEGNYEMVYKEKDNLWIKGQNKEQDLVTNAREEQPFPEKAVTYIHKKKKGIAPENSKSITSNHLHI